MTDLINGACGMEKEGDYRSCVVLRCMFVMKVKCSVGSVEVRNRPERMEPEWNAYTASIMIIQPEMFLFFCNNYWVVGKSVVLNVGK